MDYEKFIEGEKAIHAYMGKHYFGARYSTSFNDLMDVVFKIKKDENFRDLVVTLSYLKSTANLQINTTSALFKAIVKYLKRRK